MLAELKKSAKTVKIVAWAVNLLKISPVFLLKELLLQCKRNATSTGTITFTGVPSVFRVAGLNFHFLIA